VSRSDGRAYARATLRFRAAALPRVTRIAATAGAASTAPITISISVEFIVIKETPKETSERRLVYLNVIRARVNLSYYRNHSKSENITR